MSVALACTCRSAEDLKQLLEMRPVLDEIYRGITIVVPADLSPRFIRQIENPPRVSTVALSTGRRGGYLAVARSLDVTASHIHCCDLGRLLRWATSNPSEWRRVVEVIQATDCLIIGRTERALLTFEPAAQETERVVNSVFSRLLGQPVDLCSGNRGLSRQAALFVLAHSRPDGFEDAAWPLLLLRARFTVHHVTCDTTEPGVPDSAPDLVARAASATVPRHPGDQDSEDWVRKVRTALEIVQDGLTALQQPVPSRFDRSGRGAPRKPPASLTASAPVSRLTSA